MIGSWLGNGGFGGFGGNRVAGGVGYDTGAINGMSNQLNTISGQIANADRDLLMQTSSQNQFIGNLVNSTGDAIVGAINSSAMNTQQGIYNNTLNAVQSQAATNLAMCQGFGGINSSIDRGIGALNLNIADQGAQSRLQAQELAAQQQSSRAVAVRYLEPLKLRAARTVSSRERFRLRLSEMCLLILRQRMPLLSLRSSRPLRWLNRLRQLSTHLSLQPLPLPVKVV